MPELTKWERLQDWVNDQYNDHFASWMWCISIAIIVIVVVLICVFGGVNDDPCDVPGTVCQAVRVPSSGEIIHVPVRKGGDAQ